MCREEFRLRQEYFFLVVNVSWPCNRPSNGVFPSDTRGIESFSIHRRIGPTLDYMWYLVDSIGVSISI